MKFTDKIFLMLYFLMVLLYSGAEVIEEFSNLGKGNSNWHSMGEILMVLFSLVGLVYLLLLIIKQVRDKRGVDVQLKQANQQLETFNTRLQNIKKEFSSVIQLQFEEWELTPSEQEVAHLLLKGLSFKEIAEIRETKEKTVRHQATGIYTKSSVCGRNEFAAWFFEDLL
jgi:DNA-binding CsgD family transcriptional regulator